MKKKSVKTRRVHAGPPFRFAEQSKTLKSTNMKRTESVGGELAGRLRTTDLSPELVPCTFVLKQDDLEY